MAVCDTMSSSSSSRKEPFQLQRARVNQVMVILLNTYVPQIGATVVSIKTANRILENKIEATLLLGQQVQNILRKLHGDL